MSLPFISTLILITYRPTAHFGLQPRAQRWCDPSQFLASLNARQLPISCAALRQQSNALSARITLVPQLVTSARIPSIRMRATAYPNIRVHNAIKTTKHSATKQHQTLPASRPNRSIRTKTWSSGGCPLADEQQTESSKCNIMLCHAISSAEQVLHDTTQPSAIQSVTHSITHPFTTQSFVAA
ncbi:unnamed protein product [Ceratitis capitata]|uniref:(Mediterranean fruit fly) hypothetical protein n=1 Tax=Ceratitis capitata TaxID=7213 RepID=A0A811V0N6_CERCA|nr:unnamed protein product [Ceratitis capitata]